MSVIENVKTEGANMEMLRSSYLEYKKLQKRILRHGSPDIVKPCGRKPVSPNHKLATYERAKQRKKDQRKQKALEEGRVPHKIGRPKYISEPTFSKTTTGLENDIMSKLILI